MSGSLAAPRRRVARPRQGIVLREADIQRTVTDFLQAEQWRVFHFEDSFDERSKKRKGEPGMPDLLCIRYDPGIGFYRGLLRDGKSFPHPERASVLWIELKRVYRGRATKLSPAQAAWHEAERSRGALTLRAGIDFEASIEGWTDWYKSSGLARR